MPRSPRTHLLLKKQKLLKEIAYLQECVKLKEEELESVSDIIRIRGPYLSQPYKTTNNSHGRAISNRNATNAYYTESVKSLEEA